MQRQQRAIEEAAPSGAVPVQSPSSRPTRRWGSPARSGVAVAGGARSRRIWLGGGAAKPSADGHDATDTEVDPSDTAS